MDLEAFTITFIYVNTSVKLYWIACTSGHSGTMRCSLFSHSNISLFTDHKILISMPKKYTKSYS